MFWGCGGRVAFFWLGATFRKALWNFPHQDHDLKEFRGFPGMELEIFRVAKSSGEGRRYQGAATGKGSPARVCRRHIIDLRSFMHGRGCMRSAQKLV